MPTPFSKNQRWLGIVAAAILLAATYQAWQRFADPPAWTTAELEILRSLWMDNLPPLSPDPTNAVADNPLAAQMGHRLFFDPRLSANGLISCSTCHQPQRNFTDGLPRGIAIGRSKRNTPSIVGTAYSPWLYWDGRKDSQWSQALSPLEDPNEHGSNRRDILRIIAADDDYRRHYESLFGSLPDLDAAGDALEVQVDRAFANIGKAIAAYERLLVPGESRFDRYVAALLAGGDHLRQDELSADEVRGLRLFIGEARCTECHNGPLLTNNEFHNTGLLSAAGETPDRGRIDGARIVKGDPFNCLGDHSDDNAKACQELRYRRTGPELIGATRTPSLRNLHQTAPFQSKGQLAVLSDVLDHYNRAPPAMIGHNEAKELGLKRWELRQLEAFLGTLAAPVNADSRWLAPPTLDVHSTQ